MKEGVLDIGQGMWEAVADTGQRMREGVRLIKRSTHVHLTSGKR
jgi:hypothetical protein